MKAPCSRDIRTYWIVKYVDFKFSHVKRRQHKINCLVKGFSKNCVLPSLFFVTIECHLFYAIEEYWMSKVKKNFKTNLKNCLNHVSSKIFTKEQMIYIHGTIECFLPSCVCFVTRNRLYRFIFSSFYMVNLDRFLCDTIVFFLFLLCY